MIKSALEQRCGRIQGNHYVLTWLVEFAAVLLNRFEVGTDGKTAFERLRGKPSRILNLEFGEQVHFRRTRTDSKMVKLGLLWSDGVFLEYRSASAECIVATAVGIFKTRNVRRKNAHERWTAENMNMIGKTPWKLHPETDEAEAVLPNLDEQICMPAEIVMDRPKYQERDHVPRRVMITASVVYGVPLPFRWWEPTSSHRSM